MTGMRVARDIVVIGGSAGGLGAAMEVLKTLCAAFARRAGALNVDSHT